jgi:DNA-binding transcriptional ArsR family regulator
LVAGGPVTAIAAEQPDALTVTFAALADPTRRAILSRLSAGEATVNQLAEPFALTQQAISKHIKVLERAGLVSRSRVAQARPCRLEPARFEAAADWIDRHRQLWHERYDRLDDHLAVLHSDNPADDSEERAT